MIIVLFHVLYLFGKLIYTRYTCRKQTETSDSLNAECGRGDMILSSRDRNSGIEKLSQPPGDNSDDEKDMESDIRFFPPAYIQRYVAVQSVLEEARYKGKIRKVVDFGCSELGFVVYLKNTPGVEEILCVDIDKELLESCKHKASPLHVDYLHTRETPLTIHIIEGSITQHDKLLEKTDAVICIELIEHLYPEPLTELPYNVFGYIKPQVAIMTTPNVEFNVLFKKTGFRHYDHKFEWTRDQFRDWADNIVARFPDYEVSITGICKGPAGSEDLGCCSQMAIFHRKLVLNEYVIPGVEGLFKIITTHEYPFHVDNRSDEQKILDDTVYFIRTYSMYSLEYSEEVPLEKLINPLKKYYVTVESLKELLEQNGWTVVDREEGPVVLIPEPSTSENSSDRENWNDLDLSWNEHDNVEDDWDIDPGPPSHYTSEQLVEMAVSRENWDEEPSIPVDQPSIPVDQPSIPGDQPSIPVDHLSIPADQSSIPVDQSSIHVDQQSVQEVNSLNTEVTRPTNPEENIERLEETNRDKQSLSDDDIEKTIQINDETELQDPSNSSSHLDLPTQNESSSNTSKSLLNFSFKEVLNHTTELPSQKISETEFERPNDRPKSNSFSGNLPRKMYRKSPKKAQPSPRGLMDELGSLCSMYLESSRNENSKTCFEDLSNRSFESTISVTSSMNDSKADEDLVAGNGIIIAKKPRVDDSLSSFSGSPLSSSHQFASSPKTPTELKRKFKRNEQLRKREEILNEEEMWEGLNTPESVSSENLLQSNSQVSLLSFGNASISTSSLEIWYPAEENSMYKSTSVTLKNGSEAADKPRDEVTSDSDFAASDKLIEDQKDVVDSTHVNNKSSLDKSKASQESSKIVETTLANERFSTKNCLSSDLSIDGACSIGKRESESRSTELKDIRCRNFNSTEAIEPVKTKESIPKSELSVDEPENLRDESESERMIAKNLTSFVLDSCVSKALDLSEIIEVKAISSETSDTPPNSWSPEVMDSGYPNSASAHDMTPEYDLPSIAHDRISDSESPSIEEAPRPGFLELVEVENGDLANNNRDDEGNNVIAVEDNEDDDLQPFIDVLEGDIENENDIYVLQNGFPAWLLRILQMQEIDVAGHLPLYGPFDVAAGGEAGNADFDEGFSSSSEEDEVEEDDDKRINVENLQGWKRR